MATIKKIVVRALAGLSLTTYAQAADYRDEAYLERETHHRRHIPGPERDEYLASRFDEERIYRGPRHVEEERIYDQPGPERRFLGHPVGARPWWEGEDCRLTVKRRVNRWGEVIVRRVRVCD